MSGLPSIPNNLFFIWMGKSFPFWASLALRTALKKGDFDKISVYYQGFTPPEIFPEESDRKINWIPVSQELFEGLPIQTIDAYTLFTNHPQAAARANLLRLALLYKYGGIYADFDVLFIKPLHNLLTSSGFCGLEPIALPAELDQKKSIFKWVKPLFLLGLRDMCVRWPRGYRLFHKVEPWYYQAVNNAVLGAVAQNLLITEALQTIAQMTPQERMIRYRMGTHLLQLLTGNKNSSRMKVLPASAFYPLGPEICNHWFRESSGPDWQNLVGADTYIIHWYQSVEERFLKSSLNEKWLHEHPHTPYAQWVKFLLNPSSSDPL